MTCYWWIETGSGYTVQACLNLQSSCFIHPQAGIAGVHHYILMWKVYRQKKTKTENRNPQLTSPQHDRNFAGQVSDNMEGRILYFKRRFPSHGIVWSTDFVLCTLKWPVSRQWHLNAAVMLCCSTKPSCYWVKQLTMEQLLPRKE